MGKFALIIANSAYQDPQLARLKTPDADASGLAAVLRNSDIGGFDEVMTLVNAEGSVVRRRIASFFRQPGRDDLLLLYFSGHGVRDDVGQLYLAVQDTEHDLLSGTAIPASFVTAEMDRSRSRRQVLILDCCHSGAFAHGSKRAIGESVGTAAAFEGTGYGRVVLTATDSTQFAWEGDRVIGEAENSAFTHYLIQGLETGEADENRDGLISVDELYDFVYQQLVTQTSKQTPGKWSYRQQGDIVIAKSPRPPSKPIARERALDVGIAKRVPVMRPTELIALVRQIESGGLRAVLKLEPAPNLREEDVTSKPFQIEFPLDARGTPQPAPLILKVDSPDFEPRSQQKKILVPVDGDSESCSFLLTAQRAGELLLNVEVYKDGIYVAARTLRTNGEASEQAAPTGEKAVTSIPLVVTGYAGGYREAALPPELEQSIEDPRQWVRQGAVTELERLLGSSSPAVAQAARQALERLAKDDSRRVETAAKQVLEAHQIESIQAPAPSTEPPEVQAPSKQSGEPGGFDAKQAHQKYAAHQAGPSPLAPSAPAESRQREETTVRAPPVTPPPTAVEQARPEPLTPPRPPPSTSAFPTAPAAPWPGSAVPAPPVGSRAPFKRFRLALPPRVWAVGGAGAMLVIGVMLLGLVGVFGGGHPATPTPPQIAQATATARIQTAIPPIQTAIPEIVTSAPTTMPTATPRAGEERVFGGAPMVFVPAGDFLMGSSNSDQKVNEIASDVEKPQHAVYLDSFWMDKYEVTNALYKKCVDAAKCQPPSDSSSVARSSYYGNSQFDNYPVIKVSWNNAQAYCTWAGKHLPTEAQWEKAARGTDGRIYPWGNDWDPSRLNSGENVQQDTTEVGSYPAGASPYGALDMAGNVWEWVADWYDGSYYAKSPRTNPTGPSSGQYRVVRGGGWLSSQFDVRAASRGYDDPDGHPDWPGFRCVQ